MKTFYMDKNLVSQGDFAAYLAARPSAFPKDTWHYLGQGTGDTGRGARQGATDRGFRGLT